MMLEQLASLSHRKVPHWGSGLQSAVPFLRGGEGLDICKFCLL